jgi:hypothetical protein
LHILDMSSLSDMCSQVFFPACSLSFILSLSLSLSFLLSLSLVLGVESWTFCLLYHLTWAIPPDLLLMLVIWDRVSLYARVGLDQNRKRFTAELQLQPSVTFLTGSFTETLILIKFNLHFFLSTDHVLLLYLITYKAKGHLDFILWVLPKVLWFHTVHPGLWSILS